MRIFLLILLLFVAGCVPSSNVTINIAGSTSVQPIAEALAAEFQKEHPGITINVMGGGSTAGIQAVRDGAAQIGTSSRNLKKEERNLLINSKISIIRLL